MAYTPSHPGPTPEPAPRNHSYKYESGAQSIVAGTTGEATKHNSAEVIAKGAKFVAPTIVPGTH